MKDITGSIVKRIKKERTLSSMDGLLEGKIEPTNLQSLLLRVYENLVARIKAKDIVRQHRENRFVQPCSLSQREIINFDQLIYSVVPKIFFPIELSPVNPLGLNSVLSRISQKNILSTVRNIEVVADVTSALALKCARSRSLANNNNSGNSEEVHFCTSHRSIRLQQFENIPGFTSHFRVFGACSAGRDIGHEKFEAENLIRHISLYLDLLKEANQNGYFARDIVVYISDTRIIEALIECFKIDRQKIMINTQARGFTPFNDYGVKLPQMVSSTSELAEDIVRQYGLNRPISFLGEIERKAISELRGKYPAETFCFDIERIAGIGYYENLCFKIVAKNKTGMIFPLADGGMTDWTKKLLASKKERLLTSGFGSELFCKNFKR